MQEELQGKLVEILTQIQSTVGQAKDFTLQQLPDIAQSYIYYGMVYSSLVIVLSVLSVIIGLWIGFKANWNTEYLTGGILSSCVLTGVGVMVFFSKISEFLLVWVAPKVWLLKEIAVLLK